LIDRYYCRYVRLIIELHNRLNPIEAFAIELPVNPQLSAPASSHVISSPSLSTSSNNGSNSNPNESYVPMHVRRTAAIMVSLEPILVVDLARLIDQYASPFVDFGRSVVVEVLDSFEGTTICSACTVPQKIE
jgi:hypothetical protein